MEAARAWSVPRSEFLGWSQDDRDWSLALLAYEAELCSCGQPRSESTLAENEFQVYRAEKLRCHACTEIAKASERFAASSDVRGLFISLTKTTGGGHGR